MVLLVIRVHTLLCRAAGKIIMIRDGLIPVSADTKSVIWCGRYQTIDWLTNLGN